MCEKKYLVIYEAPCVGTVADTFEASGDGEAEERAFDISAKNVNYVTGGYDLYRIVYDPLAHTHALVPVIPE